MYTAHSTEIEQSQAEVEQCTNEELSDIELQSISGGAATVNVI